jgi:3-oxoadipate enol-lactonase
MQPHASWPALERGQGTPVVFLHGYPLNHEMWLPQLERLSARCRVVLLDLPGYGLARADPVPDTLSGFAESVHQSLSQHLPKRTVVVGHSFGGYVALELFRTHSDDFEALVLTNTRSEADAPEAREKRLATARRLEDPKETLDVEATVRGLFAPATWQAGDRVVDIARAMVRSAPAPTVIHTLRAIARRPDLTPVLSAISVPTLVIWGEEDQLIPPAQTRSMVTLIAGATGVGVPRAGHLPSLEAPGPFGEALENFLGHLPRPVGADD